MSRRITYRSVIAQTARALRQKQQMERAQAKDRERKARDEDRLRAQADKDAKQKYLEIRAEDTEQKNKDLAIQIVELENILEHAIGVDSSIMFSGLKDHQEFTRFELPPELIQEPIPPQNGVLNIKEPSIVLQLIPGWKERHEKVVQQAVDHYHTLEKKYESQVSERNQKIKQLEEDYQGRKKEFENSQQQHNSEVDELKDRYTKGTHTTIIA